ncbi:hypothetical protein [Aromatoleum anaerobium]|uniref:Uncharacterized protein n=1 Tax=Aromatoleum anaerobium TaxID=182180 RepID=A0ABX1PS58_9RHOO|nr:hypothetical protein [Aromatoleum anaerobium]MCK0508599.1 hypothetical protein [Aromatoleum anaerobium]
MKNLTAVIVDADTNGNELLSASARDVPITPDQVTQARLQLQSAAPLTVKVVNWPQFYIVTARNQVLVSGVDAQLVLTAFGTADFSAVITESWLARGYLFRVGIHHDQTRLELLEVIGKRYLYPCHINTRMNWSYNFEPRKFDAINAAKIYAEGEFASCP